MILGKWKSTDLRGIGFCTFSNFVDSYCAEPTISNKDKLKCLIAHISKDVYEYLSECLTYREAIQTLERLYVKPCNIFFARHLLMSCKQQQAQSLDDYLQKLKQLAKNCNYRSVSSDVCRSEAIRDTSYLVSYLTRLDLDC